MRTHLALGFAALLAAASVAPAAASPYSFSTGNPDGLMALASRPASSGKLEIEAADDFLLTDGVSLHTASFTGLLAGDAQVADIQNVGVEFYRVFPKDSVDPPSGHVPTRVNSPSDVAFTTADAGSGKLTFGTTQLSSLFSAGNSVLNGIHPVPGFQTGGDGAVRGTEVRFDITFTSDVFLPGDHYFFVPQVQLGTGDFYWLSAPKPIVPPGDAFSPDLQTWIRNEDLDPDWLRVGTDIEGQGKTYNAAFSLGGAVTPEPGTLGLLGLGLLAFGLKSIVRRRR